MRKTCKIAAAATALVQLFGISTSMASPREDRVHNIKGVAGDVIAGVRAATSHCSTLEWTSGVSHRTRVNTGYRTKSAGKGSFHNSSRAIDFRVSGAGCSEREIVPRIMAEGLAVVCHDGLLHADNRGAAVAVDCHGSGRNSGASSTGQVPSSKRESSGSTFSGFDGYKSCDPTVLVEKGECR
ncbi:MAG: hypothetical protein WAZ18_06045 [Alphaproteobacteria bacterium]